MFNLKYALVGLVGAGGVALVSLQQTSVAPAPAAPLVASKPVNAGSGALSGWNYGGANGAAGGRRKQAAPFVPVLPGEARARPETMPPLIAGLQPESPPADADALAKQAAREARRAARTEAKQQENGDESEREALRQKWQALPKEQRRAVKQECERQGYDRKQMECLQLVEYASSYPVTSSSGRKQRNGQLRQRAPRQPNP